MGVDYFSRLHTVSVGGKFFTVAGVITGSDSVVSDTGLITSTCTLSLLEDVAAGETLDPQFSTNGRWNWGNTVNIFVALEDGTLIPHPSFGTMKILKVPFYQEEDDTYCAQLDLDLACDLTFYDRETRPDEKTGIDIDTGLPVYQVIDNLLKAGNHPGLTFTPGEFAGTAMDDLLYYPLQKFDNQSFVQQAGKIAFGTEGTWFLWQTPTGETRLYSFHELIKVSQFTLDQISELPRRLARVQASDWEQPVEKIKVNGTILSVNDCDNDCNDVEEKYGSVKDIRPFWVGPEQQVLLYRYSTICTLVGNVYTRTQREEFTLTVRLSPSEWEEYTNKLTVETYTYGGPDEFLITKTTLKQAAFIILAPNALPDISLHDVELTTETYSYAPEKYVNRLFTEYAIRLLVLNGRPQPAKDDGSGVTGELNRLGADLETWDGPNECGKFTHRVVQDNSLPVAISLDVGQTTYYPVKWKSNKKLGSFEVDGPPDPQTKPGDKAPLEEFKEVECNVAPFQNQPFAPRDQTETLDFMKSNEAGLDACKFWAITSWGRPYGRQAFVPYFDKVLQTASLYPFFRVDVVDNVGRVLAMVYEGARYTNNFRTAFVELQFFMLGEVLGGLPGGDPTSVFTVRNQLFGAMVPPRPSMGGQLLGITRNRITGSMVSPIGQMAGQLQSVEIRNLSGDMVPPVGQMTGQVLNREISNLSGSMSPLVPVLVGNIATPETKTIIGAMTPTVPTMAGQVDIIYTRNLEGTMAPIPTMSGLLSTPENRELSGDMGVTGGQMAGQLRKDVEMGIKYSDSDADLVKYSDNNTDLISYEDP